MKLYVMRHGETITNQIHLISGNNETDLTENGIKQAKQARKYLENIEFDYVFTSPLSRARITASHITNKSIIIDKIQQNSFLSADLKRVFLCRRAFIAIRLFLCLLFECLHFKSLLYLQ